MSHIDRMKEELAVLADRLKKLDAFVAEPNTPFESLSNLEKRLMVDQYHAMLAYAQALAARISIA